ncbi:MAG: hypothetical protein M0R28_03335 [Pigmentiphaga sp.]|nr:hypothetical protein [Pigmentiphaga sp.]
MIGSHPTFTFAVSVSLTLALLSFGVVVLSMLVAFVLRWREINDYYKHPLLERYPFKSLPFPAQSGIYLDIFLHMQLPWVRSGIIGNANLLLKHVDPKKVPFSLRWPIAGFWGGMLLGLISQIVFFVLLIVNQMGGA